MIGYGRHGIVRKAVRLDSESPYFAIKSIQKRNKQEDIKALRNEVCFLLELDHPHIVKLYEAYEDEQYLHLVLEYCNGGDLLNYIAESGALSETQAGVLIRQIMVTVEYLHHNSISHRDLKPENFLFSLNEHHSTMKLIDFGVSSKFYNRDMYTFTGTPAYIAPEVIKGYYANSCDVWSIGIILYFVLSGTHLFNYSHLTPLFDRILVDKVEFSHRK